MDIEDLQTFVAIADAGDVSAAARRLGISKSIVSRRLLRIEKRNLESSLLRGRRAAPHLQGRNHVPGSRSSGQRRDRHRQGNDPLPAGSGLRGRLRVAMPLTFGATHFALSWRTLGRSTSAASHSYLLQRSFC